MLKLNWLNIELHQQFDTIIILKIIKNGFEKNENSVFNPNFNYESAMNYTNFNYESAMNYTNFNYESTMNYTNFNSISLLFWNSRLIFFDDSNYCKSRLFHVWIWLIQWNYF